MSFFDELKRRNVFRVGIACLVATWLLIQVSDTVFPRIGLPESAVALVIVFLLQRLISIVGGVGALRLKPPFFQKGGLEGFIWKSPSIPLLEKGGGSQKL